MNEPPPDAEIEAAEARLPDHRRVLLAFTTTVAVAAAASRGRVRARPPVEVWSDLALVGLATFKASRLVTRQTVTAAIRAPFAADAGPAGPGERLSRPVGDGLRRSMGELVSCPFCLDVWIGTAGTYALLGVPRIARPVLGALASVGIADLLHFAYVRMEHAAEA